MTVDLKTLDAVELVAMTAEQLVGLRVERPSEQVVLLAALYCPGAGLATIAPIGADVAAVYSSGSVLASVGA